MEPLTAEDPPQVGAYRLLRRLGQGGMGRVYLGRSAGGRTVAVKVVHRHVAADGQFRARFAREVAAARLVGAAWTAPVLDADPEAEIPWVATGYVAGPDLQQAVSDHGPLPPPSVRALGAGLAEALAAVHTRGLVHRDVKPSNVLLALDGPRLIDFGIARAADASSRLTATGVSVGSPGYMAPEQVLGADTGPATDVFSLGAVLAHAAAGQPPFPGDSTAARLYRVVHEEPELGRVPQELRGLVSACLAKDPGARPAPREVARVCAGEAGAAVLIRSGWLPPAVVEGVSRRAVQLLDLEAEGPHGAHGPPGPPAPVPTEPATPAAVPPAVPAPQWPVPGVPTAGAPPAARPGRRRRVPVAAAVAVALLTATGLGVYLVADAVVGPGGDGGTGSDSGNGTGTGGLPGSYVGEWEGDMELPPLGVPAGTMTITLRPGGVGEEVGTAASSDVLSLTTCVDLLTLRSVSDGELVLEGVPDPARSTEGACVQEPFEVTLSPRGENALRYSTDHPDSSTEGVLDRQL